MMRATTPSHPRGWLPAALALALLLAVPGLVAPGLQPAQGAAPAVQPAGPPHPGDLEALIAPYRDSLEVEMGEVLAVCPVDMREGEPEGLLGALVCDIVLARARAATDLPVDACVLNNGGLRAALPAGPVTLGQVYEVMPFDNEIVLLHFSGEEVRTLADQIATAGGEPVAGMSFAIEEGRAAQVRIGPPGGGEPIGDREYLIATSDYLASGGGNMSVLWNRNEKPVLTGVLVRDAMISAFRSFGERGAPAGDAGELGGSGALRKAGADGRNRGPLPVPEMGRIRLARGGG